MTDRFGVIGAGSALGFGVGPLLVGAEPGLGPSPHARVLCPGPTTTATLLYHCLHPRQGVISHAVFSDIGAELRAGDADIGVLIHEGRLTYERDGLILLEDLGTSFEQLADAPVPLGGILASLDLPPDAVTRFNQVLQRLDRLRLGESRGHAADHPRPRAGDGRGRDLAVRRALRQRQHVRARQRGRAVAAHARAHRTRGGRAAADRPPLQILG